MSAASVLTRRTLLFALPVRGCGGGQQREGSIMSSDDISSGFTRRDFLKFLGTVGVAIALPVPWDLASDEQVAAAYAKLVEEPFFFEVNEWHTISVPGVEFTLEGIADQIESEVCNLACELEDTLGEDWKDADPHELLRLAEEWRAGDLDEWDMENASFRHGPLGEAREFFLCGCSASGLDALGVVLVDGDHPGSSYYAAELRKDIAAANTAAERLNLSYRFRREGSES
jgi:hypothetical protein